MNKEELRTLLTRHGIVSRIRSGEVQVRDCIFCGNPRWNLELNPDKGVYHCWACKASNPINKLFKELSIDAPNIPVRLKNDTPHKVELTSLPVSVPANEIRTAKKYLENRKIGLKEIHEIDIRICTDKSDKHYLRIIFPVYHYFEQYPVGFISRAYLPKKRPKYLADYPTNIPIGYRPFKPNTTKHVVVEGPTDAIKVSAAGYNALILGGKGSQKILTEWSAALLEYDSSIDILLDSDAKESANRIYWTMYPINPNITIQELPEGTDPGDLTPAQIKEILG